MRGLKDKRVLVTGGASGIGAATAARFLEEGSRVCVLDRDAVACKHIKQELAAVGEAGVFSAGLTSAIIADVTDLMQVEAAFAEAIRLMDGVDVVINNAGISIRHKFLDITPEEWDRVIAVNLTGMFYVAQTAARHMWERYSGEASSAKTSSTQASPTQASSTQASSTQASSTQASSTNASSIKSSSANSSSIKPSSGVILQTASTNGVMGYPYYADYNATKAGVIELTRSMALELAPRVRVCAVAPGYVLTPMQRAEYSDAMLEEVNRKIPLGRHATPEEIAGLFAYLASDDAAFATGQVFTMDGGETAGGLASR
jgi:meso-butanediol dehydrogenase / (S,S)-butanediol dehydrogenase / diacetyl reductase